MRNKIDLEFMKIVFEESINFKKKINFEFSF